ncbi:MAG: type II toxin-antitoxin system RelE/ParE family toxin [Saprospiraceae bacterium]|nr:type II toxin-antitoxin system RelE/ParE family toxin [Saprospiraceae bacterium]MDZ4705211.1 type II toxin-antitoxin system RelE/ParE family toxin [Saprospiraceae bacterium]
MEALRQIGFYKDHFLDFYDRLDKKARDKIKFVLEILRTQWVVPLNHVKHITNSDGIYEIIAPSIGNDYRTLFFFKEGDLISGGNEIVLLNGFMKKSKKDYLPAAKKAELLKIQYFNEHKDN